MLVKNTVFAYDGGTDNPSKSDSMPAPIGSTVSVSVSVSGERPTAGD